jgi:hypothetical protein
MAAIVSSSRAESVPASAAVGAAPAAFWAAAGVARQQSLPHRSMFSLRPQESPVNCCCWGEGWPGFR